MKTDGDDDRYTYPGREYDYATDSLLADRRLFFGVCVKPNEESAVWYQRELDDSGSWKESLYMVTVKDDHLVSESINDSVTISELVKRMERSCSEVTGIDSSSEP